MPPTPPIELIRLDPWLAPYERQLLERMQRLEKALHLLEPMGGLSGAISLGHTYFGLNPGTRDGKPGVWYREWAPQAEALFLTGDFNGWSRTSLPLQRDEFGVWSVFLRDDTAPVEHADRVKVHIHSAIGPMDRIPAYARRVVQDPETGDFAAQYWNPPTPYKFQRSAPHMTQRTGLRIYEAHVGMAQEDASVGTFEQFRANVLPRIAALGYNCVQLMAIQEHPYYGSFGYHVSGFFAVSSRFGTPEELKALIDEAHRLGMLVLLDIVHSHAVKNLNEGLAQLDGSDSLYFHAGPRGMHPLWDSLVFDYSKFEVQRFLLSNVRYWLEEFKFDGMRFDGVTSMIYLHHGASHAFTSYDDYFGSQIDDDAVTYLQMANLTALAVDKQAVTIAEEVSGMPGLARPCAEGGLGFGYRLAMGIPDYWIKLVKEKRDEDWDLAALYHTLMNRRYGEKHVAYAESHDQALVGDKTLAFRLMDSEMYWNMARNKRTAIIDRGIALHKMIRLITFMLGGEAWLNFMGNEFGHPEWIDFPREGNGFSYHHARRQWSLVDNPELCYAGLANFDGAMQQLDARYSILTDSLIEQLALHQDTGQLVFRHGALVAVFNFHPANSYSDLRIPVPDDADYQVVLNSDDIEYAGMGLATPDSVYPVQKVPLYGRAQSVQIYLPARSAQVLAPVGQG